MGKRKSKTAKQKQVRAATKQAVKVMGGVSVLKKKARSTVEALKLPWDSKFKTPPTPKPSSNTTPRPLSTTPSSTTTTSMNGLTSNTKRKMNEKDTAAAATKERQEFHQQLASLLERKSVAAARKSKRKKKKGGAAVEHSFTLAPATFTWNDDDATSNTTRLVEEAMMQVQSFSIGTNQPTVGAFQQPPTSSALPGTTNALQVLAQQYREQQQQQQQQQQQLLWTSPASSSVAQPSINANNPYALLAEDGDSDDENHPKTRQLPFSFAPPSFSIAPPQPMLSMDSLRIGGDAMSGGAFDDYDPDL